MISLRKNAARQKWDQRYAEAYNALVHHEAKVGGGLFGAVPEGRRREFFMLDERTFIWHEEWQDQTGAWQTVTTRYDARPGGILKSQGSNTYQPVDGPELENLIQAIRLYVKQIGSEQQRMLHAV